MCEAATVTERAAQAGAVLAPIASAELWRLSDDEVETALVALLRTEAALAAARAGLPVEAEARSLRIRTQALSRARWLTPRMRVSRARGERLLREADLVAAGRGRDGPVRPSVTPVAQNRPSRATATRRSPSRTHRSSSRAPARPRRRV